MSNPPIPAPLPRLHVPIAVTLAYAKNAARIYSRWSRKPGAGALTCFQGYAALESDAERRYYLRARLAIIRSVVSDDVSGANTFTCRS